MTYNDKFNKLRELDSNASINLTHNGFWYVAFRADVSDKPGILSGVVAWAKTPTEAINKLFASLTGRTKESPIILNAYGNRRHVIWSKDTKSWIDLRV